MEIVVFECEVGEDFEFGDEDDLERSEEASLVPCSVAGGCVGSTVSKLVCATL